MPKGKRKAFDTNEFQNCSGNLGSRHIIIREG